MTLRLLGAERGLTPDQWREEQYAAHRAEYAEFAAQTPERERKNFELALSLARLDTLTFRDVTYTVGFLSVDDGLELVKLRGDMVAIGKHAAEREAENKRLREAGEREPDFDHEPTLRQMLAIMERLAALFWKNVSLPVELPPTGLLARVRHAYRMARAAPPAVNPFLAMTEREARELLDFFFECRTRSSVRLSDRTAPPLRLT